MNIDELTIGQAKQIVALLRTQQEAEQTVDHGSGDDDGDGSGYGS